MFRTFDCCTWTGDEWFQELTRDQRYLFIYLLTSPHQNHCGACVVTTQTVANETAFALDEVRTLLPSLAPHVVWVRAASFVWVRRLTTDYRDPRRIVAAMSHRHRQEVVGAFPELQPDNESLPAKEIRRRRREWDSLRPSVWPALLDRDGKRCKYCGATKNLTADHVIAITLGGSNHISNLVVACRSCNSSKGAQHPEAPR